MKGGQIDCALSMTDALEIKLRRNHLIEGFCRSVEVTVDGLGGLYV